MTIPDYTPIYEGDRYCLMCRHVCPVERVTKREATSPHGWALLVASEQRGLVRWDADTVDTLYQCADCGLCQANCATDRPLPAAIVAARASVVERGFAPAAALAVRDLLKQYGHPFGESFINPFADMPRNTGEIGLFVGAGTTYADPHSVEAASRLLNAAGAGHNLLSTARSGVYLPYTLGLWDAAREIARDTLAEIDALGVRQVVTLSREDAHAFTHLYAEIGIPLPEDLRVIEFVEWLKGALGGGELHLNRVDLEGYVYHDPCHTTRALNNTGVSRALIRETAGGAPGELFWRERCAAPCGALGGFQFTQPALAEKLARARLAEARQAGARGIVTEDPHCSAHLARFAEGLPVVNLIEVLAEGV